MILVYACFAFVGLLYVADSVICQCQGEPLAPIAAMALGGAVMALIGIGGLLGVEIPYGFPSGLVALLFVVFVPQRQLGINGSLTLGAITGRLSTRSRE